MLHRLAVLTSLILIAGTAGAQEPSKPQQPDTHAAKSPPASAQNGDVRGAAKRNENVPVYQIDNNALKEANIRLGSQVTPLTGATVDRGYFGAEFGNNPGSTVTLPALAPPPQWHAELFELHQNSVFNARSFFQAGDVKPSHRNQYGGRFGARLAPGTYFSADAAQHKIRGMVNGNVLVPLASERTPTATDPTVRAEVQRLLAAFPDELPNRPDFDPRALNTNAPQRIDQVNATLRLDQDIASSRRLTLLYNVDRMTEDAFQFVAGMNPDTTIHSQRTQIGFDTPLGPQADLALGFSFQRTRSALVPEPNAVGPRVRFGFQIQELGPDPEFPVDRALNTFRGGGHLAWRTPGGRHAVMLGADLTRRQLNSFEAIDHRGYYSFGNAFGHTAIENFLDGTPSFYSASVGYFPRGFRDWAGNMYAADTWRPRPRLEIYYGLRYSFQARPVEVNNLDRVPYACDCNNFSPRLSLAWRMSGGWVARAYYTVSFGGIPPVTYQQVRNNLPLVRYVQVQNPDFLDPLRDVDLNDKNGRTAPTFLSSDLVSPYAHQFGATLERQIRKNTHLRLSYIGSRSVKLITAFTMNRAEPTPGIELSLATVDQRRPDPRYYDTFLVLNAGLGYFNAGQATLETTALRGLAASLTYTFSKAIDEGADYTGTAANNDLVRSRHQWQYEASRDRRGYSNFDTPHSLQLNYAYQLPALAATHGPAAAVLNGWQLAGAILAKSGTPFTLYIGSDAPGFGNVDGGPGDRPNILDPSILGATIGSPDTSTSILRRDRFAYITPGEHRGSTGRNAFRKAAIRNWNASLSKVWNWSGRREGTAVLRVEVYNLTNTPQFDEPQRNLSSPSFGQITNTLNDGRIFQLGLQLIL